MVVASTNAKGVADPTPFEDHPTRVAQAGPHELWTPEHGPLPAPYLSHGAHFEDHTMAILSEAPDRTLREAAEAILGRLDPEGSLGGPPLRPRRP